MPVINIPKVLRDKLGEEGADALVDLINAADTQAKADVLTFAEEKFERRLAEEAAKLDHRITEESARLDKRITEESARLDKKITEEVARLDKSITEEVAKLDVRISEVKADLIRWMFIFWVGQIGAVLGILFAFFRR
jgi:leucyl aminopeptidase (aminopeptidase T)